MDQAILRPGRLGRLLYVPLPSPDERGLILKALARRKPIDSSVDLMTIGRDDACKNLSGADLAALMNEAAMVALEDKLTAMDTSCGDISSTIKESHFRRALEKISPSICLRQANRILSEIIKKLQSSMKPEHESLGEGVERRCLGGGHISSSSHGENLREKYFGYCCFLRMCMIYSSGADRVKRESGKSFNFIYLFVVLVGWSLQLKRSSECPWRDQWSNVKEEFILLLIPPPPFTIVAT